MPRASLALRAANASTTRARRATTDGRAKYSSILIAKAAAIGWSSGATATAAATSRRSTGRWPSSARDYFDALKGGRLKVLREIE
jgi:hypothetical protein